VTAPGRKGDGRGGYTLLEIVIAILTSAALPYLFDAFANAEGDRACEALATKARDTRSLAMDSGTNQVLSLSATGLPGLPLPSGWSLLVKGLNDEKFHPPEKGRTWLFTSSGVCEPLSLRLVEHGGKGRCLDTRFDALTALPLHEEE
jgi:type II secretory pathway pseudopilin PulG